MTLEKLLPLNVLVIIATTAVFLGCANNQTPVTQKKAAKKSVSKKEPVPEATNIAFNYHFISARSKNKAVRDSAQATLKALTPSQLAIVLKLNRVDAASYKRLDTMIIPDVIDTNWMAYSIFPAELPVIKDVQKMIVFAYYPEAFGAYENGRLVRWGPTNMGKKATPTPTGLFFTNWKAKETISTVSDEWKLKWNFNIANFDGVGFHQYQLPGYPASHSCLRLLESDAMYFYSWASQWILQKGEMLANGTPVLVFGTYPFGKPKPWWSLVQNPAALNVATDTLTALLQPQIDKILAAQTRRDSVAAQIQQKAMLDSSAVTTIAQP